MNRTQILNQYRQRIRLGDRIKLTTQERAALVQDFVTQLRRLNTPEAIRKLCQDEIALLEEGYGKGSNSTTNYLSKYRSAIAEAVERGQLGLTHNTISSFTGHKQATGEPIEVVNHLAWSLMRYDNSVYAANRRATNLGNNARQDNPQPFVPDLFLDKVRELLQAEEAETLAVGIAAVTGRRHTEVAVSGRFQLTQHPYLLCFDGQLKKDQPVEYSIVTLLPAREVIKAIERFRNLPQVQELAGLTSEDQPVKNFRARVNSRVKQHFQKTKILPLLPGFESVSVHRLRGAYARMAVYFWLPNQGANEQRFLQFYLGHVEANDMADAPNSNSTTHYFGYRLMDRAGQPITASGIKLMSNPALPHPTESQIEQQQQFNHLLQGDRVPEPQVLLEADQSALNQPINQPIHQPTKQPTQKVEVAEPPMLAVPDAIQTLAQQLEMLPDKQPRQMQLPVEVELEKAPIPQGRAVKHNQEQPTPAKPAKPRFKELAVDVETLTAVAERLGLQLTKGKGRGYEFLLAQVLESVTDHPVPVQQPLVTPENNFPAALTALTQEVAALRQAIAEGQLQQQPKQAIANDAATLQTQLAQAESEREQLQAQLNSLQAVKQERDLLQDQLRTTQGRLEQFLSLAQGAATDQIQHNGHESAATSAAEPELNRAQTKQGSKSRSKRPPEARITAVIDALMRYNEGCTDPKDRWFISVNVIAEMSGTNPATKVKPWLTEHSEIAEKIADHNRLMQTTKPHHNRGRDRTQLMAIGTNYG